MNDCQAWTRERLDVLADQIATYSLRIDLATQAMLTHLREFDAHDGWVGSGFVSTATCLSALSYGSFPAEFGGASLRPPQSDPQWDGAD